MTPSNASATRALIVLIWYPELPFVLFSWLIEVDATVESHWSRRRLYRILRRGSGMCGCHTSEDEHQHENFSTELVCPETTVSHPTSGRTLR